MAKIGDIHAMVRRLIADFLQTHEQTHYSSILNDCLLTAYVLVCVYN